MNFINRLFSGSPKSEKIVRPDIEALLQTEDEPGAMLAIDSYIVSLCEYGESIERLSEPQKVFYFNQRLEGEINNGGFDQFFFNSSGNFAHETMASLNAIGAHKTAALLKEAIDQFPNAVVPKDQEIRRNLLAEMEETCEEAFERLDQAFYKYEDNLNALNLEYMRQNIGLF